MEVGVALYIAFFEAGSIPSAEIGRITYQRKEIWPPPFILKCVSATLPFRRKSKRVMFYEERRSIKVLKPNANVEIYVFFSTVPVIGNEGV